MPKRMVTTVVGLVGVVLVATVLTGCRPYSGSTPVWTPGYKCRGKVGIVAPETGQDEIRLSLPTSGDHSCVDSEGYRAVASMRVYTEGNPGGSVVQVPIAGEKRYRYTKVTKVRFRIQYKTACDTAVIDVGAGTASHDPKAC